VLLLVLAVYLVPFCRVLRNVVLGLPVGNVAADEGFPKFGSFTFYLWRTLLNYMKLFRIFNACQDRLNLPEFEVANIDEA
jgi:hypothetical protein